MIEALVPDGLWDRVAPLLPAPNPRHHRHPGRRPLGDRAALAGIVFVLKTGIAGTSCPQPARLFGSPAGGGVSRSGLVPALDSANTSSGTLS